MRKSAVYSWRLDPAHLTELESCARDEGLSVAALLERITRDWLASRLEGTSDDEAEREQALMRADLLSCVGTLSPGEPRRAERVSELMRKKLSEKP